MPQIKILGHDGNSKVFCMVGFMKLVNAANSHHALQFLCNGRLPAS